MISSRIGRFPVQTPLGAWPGLVRLSPREWHKVGRGTAKWQLKKKSTCILHSIPINQIMMDFMLKISFLVAARTKNQMLSVPTWVSCMYPLLFTT